MKLVDHASRHALVSVIQPLNFRIQNLDMVTVPMVHTRKLGSSLVGFHKMDTTGNSGANTCKQTRLMKGCVW